MMRPATPPLSRRTLLRGLCAGGSASLGLPPLEAMFDGRGRALAGEDPENRLIVWFNGNGIPEKYWIPSETGVDVPLPPCLSPLSSMRTAVHIISGLDNAATRLPGPGNGHTNSMAGLMALTGFSGRGAGGPSIDQLIAQKVGGQTRFRSLEIGVCQESFGESMQRNMSWAAANRPLPPEMLPHKLFDRLFGQRELGWTKRKRSVLDAVHADAAFLKQALGQRDRDRLDEHMAAVRDLEHAITSLPPAYKEFVRPEEDGDMRDWPRIAKLQSDLLVAALATGQTRVATYMLTKRQSLTRFPWLGHTVLRHHDYTHYEKVPGTGQPGQKALRDICRWHVQELAYLLGRLAAVPEGAGTLLDHTCVLFLHEHAEGNDHKNTGMAAIAAGGAGGLRTNRHSRVNGTFADLYLAMANHVMKASLETLPTASAPLEGVWG